MSDSVTRLEAAVQLPNIRGSLYVAELPPIPLTLLPDNLEDRKCALCITAYGASKEDPIVQLPCRHLYDKGCINEWLSEEKAGKNTCPTCRTVLFEHVDDLPVQRQEADEDLSHEGISNPEETNLQRLERAVDEALQYMFNQYCLHGIRKDFELYDELRLRGAPLPERNLLRNGLELSVDEELALFTQLRERKDLVLRRDMEDGTEWIARVGTNSYSLRDISGTWSHDDNGKFTEFARRDLLREAFNSGADLNLYGSLIYDLLSLEQW